MARKKEEIEGEQEVGRDTEREGEREREGRKVEYS